MEKFRPEHREKPEGVDLRVVPSQGDKHHMIGFDAKTDETAEAYNEAISFYLEQEKLQGFHQVGSEGGPGFSAWEVWAKVDEIKLAKLLPKIERAANILLTNEGGRIDQLYAEWYPDTE